MLVTIILIKTFQHYFYITQKHNCSNFNCALYVLIVNNIDYMRLKMEVYFLIIVYFVSFIVITFDALQGDSRFVSE